MLVKKKYGYKIKEYLRSQMDLLVFLLNALGLLGNQWWLGDSSLYGWKKGCSCLVMLVFSTRIWFSITYFILKKAQSGRVYNCSKKE
jgi:hypothetical protein